ncbi:MAG TPA: ERAP1-like C-terminal domain-containing protein, partial [Candidatus Eisenbacteria bacterium]
GEEDGVSLVRPSLVFMLGDYGQDARVLAFADSLSKQYIAAPASVDPSLAGVALSLSALRADASLFADYKRRFETAKIPADRSRFLNALGHFRDPKLVEEVLGYSLQAPVRPQEVFTIANAVGSAIENEDLLYGWIEEHFGAISTKIPPMYVVFLAGYAGGCSVKRLEAAKAFFAGPPHAVPGTDKELAKVADQVKDCAGLREREGAVVAAYLSQSVGAR